jgi:putative hemolysin
VVCRDGLDHIAGVLRTSDLLKPMLAGEPLDIEARLREPLYVPDSVTTTRLLESFRQTRMQIALIVDEYGELEGLVTLTDVLTSIVGELPSADGSEEMDVVTREDGSWLVDGSVPIERLKSALDIEDDLPGEEENAFNTLGGFVMHMLGRVPAVADHFEWPACASRWWTWTATGWTRCWPRACPPRRRSRPGTDPGDRGRLSRPSPPAPGTWHGSPPAGTRCP